MKKRKKRTQKEIMDFFALKLRSSKSVKSYDYWAKREHAWFKRTKK